MCTWFNDTFIAGNEVTGMLEKNGSRKFAVDRAITERVHRLSRQWYPAATMLLKHSHSARAVKIEAGFMDSMFRSSMWTAPEVSLSHAEFA